MRSVSSPIDVKNYNQNVTFWVSLLISLRHAADQLAAVSHSHSVKQRLSSVEAEATAVNIS